MSPEDTIDLSIGWNRAGVGCISFNLLPDKGILCIRLLQRLTMMVSR